MDQLVIETYELTGKPDPETLKFTSVDGQEFTAADFDVSMPFPSNQMEGTPLRFTVTINGESLNEQNGYEESINFQTINGRPFYFFRNNGKVDAWFDGNEISLGYDDVPHYLCCGDSGLNPKARQGAVLFFGNKDNQWNFVRIAAPGVLK